jgi:hypothetical protein
MSERAANLYREGGRLTFHASGPSAKVEVMIVRDGPWRVEGDDLVFDWHVREVRLTPGQAYLAARNGMWGLGVWYERGTKAAAPKKGGKAKAWKGPR